MLTPEQRDRAVAALKAYLTAPGEDGVRSVQEEDAEWSRRRSAIIEQELRPLLSGYLAGGVPLPEFKSKVDSINKRYDYWGFKGIKGQMFFNLATNVASDPAELDAELKAALAAPADEDLAKSRINNLTSYIRRLGEEHVATGGNKAGRPAPNSVPFFVSYFWQIQQPEVWPAYYTNTVKVMADMNLWQPTDDLAADYIRFKQTQEELAELFTGEARRPMGLYDVEYVFWLQGGNPYNSTKPPQPPQPPQPPTSERTTEVLPPVVLATGSVGLPDSYVPPLVAVLPRMARHEPELVDAAKASGTTIEVAFEKYIDAAFTMLGYETKRLGQGQGRVPDGIATDHDSSYAILWDAKIRAQGYSIGTDDRAIREYITTQSRELKKRRTLRNIYYAIISSGFADDFDETVRAIKMETDVNEVVLMEADALVAMVDTMLRDPRGLSLGPDGLQRLFSTSGVLTSDTVRQLLS